MNLLKINDEYDCQQSVIKQHFKVPLVDLVRPGHSRWMKIANITEAKANLSKLIEMVLDGKSVILAKAGKPVAKLIPFDEESEDRILSGPWQGKVSMSEDFDELPDEFMSHFDGQGKTG